VLIEREFGLTVDCMTLDALLTPGNVREVLLGKGGDGIAAGDELAVVGLDGTLEAVVGRILLKHVCLYMPE